MRTTAGVTAGVAALGVLSGAAGHALVTHHPVSPAVLPRLGLLASLCFVLATQRLGTPALVAALSLVQVGVHVVLMAAPAPPVQAMHDHERMAMPAAKARLVIDAPMLGMHLGAMLGTLLLLRTAGRCWEQLVGALGRVIPALPRLCGMPPVARTSSAYGVRPAPYSRRWLPSSPRRGPPTTCADQVHPGRDPAGSLARAERSSY
jgi:hypothetical protein